MSPIPRHQHDEGIGDNDNIPPDRRAEWFVPRFGPLRFRLWVGLLFLPYTGMVLGYTIIGAMLAEQVHWNRVAAVVLIYFLALGIGAHALDALGSTRRKPWGDAFGRRQLLVWAVTSLTAAYAIGIYYIILYAPWLAVIAILEGFFLLTYNLEWFRGRFHTDAVFALSWGSLPVLAGYVLQTNSISTAALAVAVATGLLSLAQIKASRPYKALARGYMGSDPELAAVHRYQLEAILKSLSLGVILLALGLALFRWGS